MNVQLKKELKELNHSRSKATVSSVRVAGTLSYYILYTYKFRDLGSVCVCVRERFRRLSEGDANLSYEINHYI